MNARNESEKPDQVGHGFKPAASRRSVRRSEKRSTPPYNPGLHKLVAGKQAWAEPLDTESKAKGFRGWHQRGYLPHHDVPGVTQFITFRLHDAMPASRRSEWEALLRLENERERRTKLEAYLDQGLGKCWLRRSDVAGLAEGALRFFDGQRYQLQAWVVMPNHIHVVMDVWQTPMASLLQSWKRFIAREANQLLGREGTFWEREYWDMRITDAGHLAKSIRYVEVNPVKAGLAREAKDGPWSSARFRDGYGRLPMPEGAPT